MKNMHTHESLLQWPFGLLLATAAANRRNNKGISQKTKIKRNSFWLTLVVSFSLSLSLCVYERRRRNVGKKNCLLLFQWRLDIFTILGSSLYRNNVMKIIYITIIINVWLPAQLLYSIPPLNRLCLSHSYSPLKSSLSKVFVLLIEWNKTKHTRNNNGSECAKREREALERKGNFFLFHSPLFHSIFFSFLERTREVIMLENSLLCDKKEEVQHFFRFSLSVARAKDFQTTYNIFEWVFIWVCV